MFRGRRWNLRREEMEGFAAAEPKAILGHSPESPGDVQFFDRPVDTGRVRQRMEAVEQWGR